MRLHSPPRSPYVPEPPHGARCAVVATRVEWQATPAGTHSGGKRSQRRRRRSKRRLTIEPAVMGDREAGERQTRHWASLGPEQSTGLEREARPQTRAHKLFLQRHRGDNLPPLPGPRFPIVHVVVPWARRVVTNEVSPAGAWKPASNKGRVLLRPIST